MKKLLVNDTDRLESREQVLHNFKETARGTDFSLSTKLRFRPYMPMERANDKHDIDCVQLIRKAIKNLKH
jgi:hypothetical protein